MRSVRLAVLLLAALPASAFACCHDDSSATVMYLALAVPFHGLLFLALVVAGILTSLFGSAETRERGAAGLSRAGNIVMYSFLSMCACIVLDLASNGARGVAADILYRTGLAVALVAVVRVPSWAREDEPPRHTPRNEPRHTVRHPPPAPLPLDQLRVVSVQLTGTAARCPVCGTAAGDDAAWCARCETPHHADCLKYNGRCGTYGCDPYGRRTPSTAKPVR